MYFLSLIILYHNIPILSSTRTWRGLDRVKIVWYNVGMSTDEYDVIMIVKDWCWRCGVHITKPFVAGRGPGDCPHCGGVMFPNCKLAGIKEGKK